MPGNAGFHIFKTFSNPRRCVRTGQPVKRGGVSLLVHTNAEHHIVRVFPESSLPPETLAVEFSKKLFGTSRNVVVIVSYITKIHSKIHKEYKSKFGHSLYDLVTEFIRTLRVSDMEVLFLGDLNGHTGNGLGWEGGDPIWNSGQATDWRRISDCRGSRGGTNAEGRAILM